MERNKDGSWIGALKFHHLLFEAAKDLIPIDSLASIKLGKANTDLPA